jgi:hypothetical protein
VVSFFQTSCVRQRYNKKEFSPYLDLGYSKNNCKVHIDVSKIKTYPHNHSLVKVLRRKESRLFGFFVHIKVFYDLVYEYNKYFSIC